MKGYYVEPDTVSNGGFAVYERIDSYLDPGFPRAWLFTARDRETAEAIVHALTAKEYMSNMTKNFTAQLRGFFQS